jgi:tRNA pseudouridine13 synthase
MMKESELGLEVFITSEIPGIGGKLRKTPEDFAVDEVSLLPPEAPDGKYVVAKVWHRNWEANRLVRRLASNLRIGRGKVGFAGTKDGRSVATQLMSFDAPMDSVAALTIPDVMIIEPYRARRMVSIGDLIGNSFRIKVSDIPDGTDTDQICPSVFGQLEELGGFPNFFGPQRFGSVRPITHLIGKDLIRGDIEGAVMKYIANPSEEEMSEANDARAALQETRDYEKALKEFPTKLTFERTLIGHLKDNPEDYLGALRKLPRNLLMMFVHAYQSYLFNKMLSERLRRGISIKLPEVGDLILPLNKAGLPDHDGPLSVDDANLPKVVAKCREKKAFVSGLLYGTESQFAGGPMGEIERKVIEDENIQRPDFQIVGLREASSSGTRRELLAIYKNFSMDLGQNEATFCFTLNKGCYATALLREFMKAEMNQY